MKILITTDLYTTQTNGVVTSVKNLVESLEKLGHEVRILTLSQSTKSRKEGNIHFIRSLSFPVYPDVRMPLSYRHRLIKELAAWKPDVIHSQCEFFSLQFAKYLHKKTGAPIVHTYHTLYEQYAKYVIPFKKPRNWAVRTVSRVRLKKAACIIAPTRKVEAALRSYGLQNKIAVIPTGIDLKQHEGRISPQQRRDQRESLGIYEENVALINLGRLGTEKNISELIAFFAKALPLFPQLRFLIVGGGPASEQLKKEAKELGVEKEVIFTGMVDPKKVQEYYQLGDLFVSASTSETQGLTYVEAAANGLPLLCRKDPCLVDVIREGENGYQYDNEEEFLHFLKKVLSDPRWRATAGKLSESISQSFSKQAFGEAVEQLYKETLT